MPDFIRIETNPVPRGGEVFDFKGADGGRLRGAIFQAQDPRGGVVLMAGRSEFIEKYFEVVNDLLSRRLSVATMDWRGQGLSERLLPVSEKGHITDFGVYRADLRKFTDEVARQRFSGPLFLMTHSMGGLPALQLLADGYDAFDAAVLSAPMTRLFADPLKAAYARVMSNLACSLGASRQSILGVKEHSLKFEGNVLTSDRARHARFRELQAAAPNAAIREPTYGWLKAAIDAIDDIHKPERFAELKTPVLIVSAENDHLVDTSDHALLASRSPLIKETVVKGSLHEILMESDQFRNAFWNAFDAFIDPRLAAKDALVKSG